MCRPGFALEDWMGKVQNYMPERARRVVAREVGRGAQRAAGATLLLMGALVERIYWGR